MTSEITWRTRNTYQRTCRSKKHSRCIRQLDYGYMMSAYDMLHQSESYNLVQLYRLRAWHGLSLFIFATIFGITWFCVVCRAACSISPARVLSFLLCTPLVCFIYFNFIVKLSLWRRIVFAFVYRQLLPFRNFPSF